MHNFLITPRLRDMFAINFVVIINCSPFYYSQHALLEGIQCDILIFRYLFMQRYAITIMFQHQFQCLLPLFVWLNLKCKYFSYLFILRNVFFSPLKLVFQMSKFERALTPITQPSLSCWTMTRRQFSENILIFRWQY